MDEWMMITSRLKMTTPRMLALREFFCWLYIWRIALLTSNTIFIRRLSGLRFQEFRCPHNRWRLTKEHFIRLTAPTRQHLAHDLQRRRLGRTAMVTPTSRCQDRREPKEWRDQSTTTTTKGDPAKR